jgi:hypothetical protein
MPGFDDTGFISRWPRSFEMFLAALIEIALRFAQDNLDVKKVSAPSKNPAKWLIMCFSRLKNIKSLTSKNSGTLIVIK